MSDSVFAGAMELGWEIEALVRRPELHGTPRIRTHLQLQAGMQARKKMNVVIYFVSPGCGVFGGMSCNIWKARPGGDRESMLVVYLAPPGVVSGSSRPPRK